MKFSHRTLAFIIFIVIAITSMVVVTANAAEENSTNLEKQEIREVIQTYFDRRYSSRAANQVGDFRDLTDGSLQADAFLESEMGKLEMGIQNAKLHHLGYTQYKFTLDINDISIDKENLSATVSLTEGHDVVFEISEMISKASPIVSKMRNLDHTIVLKKTPIGWKIVTDHYNDYLWRMLRAANLSIDEIQNQVSSVLFAQSEMTSCNLPADDSTHPYNRVGAVTYAHQYATDHNPAYHYYIDNDCTNFVNQAIHHGSNAEEVGSNTFGWYYNYYNSDLDNDVSYAWAYVQPLYEFITQYYVWDKGPEGCEVSKSNIDKGDLVQFEWFEDYNGDGIDDNTDWDHSMIIVRKEILYDEAFYYVAGHSVDVDNYPMDDIAYVSRRFIRIERIDGYYKVYIPLVIKGLLELSESFVINPYPAPIDSGEAMQPQAYPAP